MKCEIDTRINSCGKVLSSCLGNCYFNSLFNIRGMLKLIMRVAGIKHYLLFYKKMITFNVQCIQKIEAMQVILLLCLTTKKPSLQKMNW